MGPSKVDGGAQIKGSLRETVIFHQVISRASTFISEQTMPMKLIWADQIKFVCKRVESINEMLRLSATLTSFQLCPE